MLVKAVESYDTYLYTYIDVSIRVVLRVSVCLLGVANRPLRPLAEISNFDRDDPVAAFIRRAIKNVDGNARKNINDSGVFAGACKQGTRIGALRRRKLLAGSDRVVT